jgi:endonuclease/exonuclease/phosphatase family metal-dependent hydrolase
MRILAPPVALLLAAALAAAEEEPAPPPALAVAAAADVTSGTFSLLTYNVAGLPQGVSRSRPQVNMVRIGPRLGAYDIALLQEDFAYHRALLATVPLPYASPDTATRGPVVGDGLHRFSRHPFTGFHRVPWSESHGLFGSGSDALARKGASLAWHGLAPGVSLLVVNLHADAGHAEGDLAARRAQFAQLASHIDACARGRALVIAGDTNCRRSDPRDAAILDAFAAALGLTDANVLVGEAECIDRVFFRAGAAGEGSVALRPLHWRFAEEFVDEAGRPLSDHRAVCVEFTWRRDGAPDRVGEERD